MTADDIKTLVRIHFSYKGVKLWKYEPYKKLISGVWHYIKGLGYPKGTPDLMGWSKDGIVYGVEIKTINDRLSRDQKKMLDLMIVDNCAVFVASEQADESIKIKNWNKIKEIKLIINSNFETCQAEEANLICASFLTIVPHFSGHKYFK